jgi:hypothetical protein
LINKDKTADMNKMIKASEILMFLLMIKLNSDRLAMLRR